MAYKKKQEDKHQQVLKTFLQHECNRRCFECNQMGPMYVDVTIGSFVCSMCGGVLRGLTSPHRVKSISMSSFTSAEINFLETRGNKYCKNVYLGCYDSRCKAKPEKKDIRKLKIFMEQKYVEKRWYVSPDIANQPSKSSLDADLNKKTVETVIPKVNLLNSAVPSLATDPPAKNQKDVLSSPLVDLSSPIVTNIPAPFIAENNENFADFGSAFPPTKFDPFCINNNQHQKNETASSLSHGDTSVHAPSNSCFNLNKSPSTKPIDKYADLRDLFKTETFNETNTSNTWVNFGNSSKIEASFTNNSSYSGARAVDSLPNVFSGSSSMTLHDSNNLASTPFDFHHPPTWSASTFRNVPTAFSSMPLPVNMLVPPAYISSCQQVPPSIFQPTVTTVAPLFGCAQTNTFISAGSNMPAPYTALQSQTNGNLQLPNQFNQPLVSQHVQNPFIARPSYNNPILQQATNSNPFLNVARPQQPTSNLFR